MTRSFRSDPLRCALVALLAGLLPAGMPQAADPPGPGQRELLDEAVLAVASQHAGDAATPIRIEQPARVRHEFGAVVDVRPEDGGLPRVMAVTPGGAAARMGLAAGDRLLAIGGLMLGAGVDAGRALREAVESGEPLRLSVQRGAAQVEVGGHVDRLSIPAYRLEILPETATAGGCGRVSIAVKPPVSQRLFPALLHEIDGRLPGPLSSTSFRLPAGRHVLKLSELVDDSRFDTAQNRRRGQLMRHERFKYLEIEVRPDTTYRIGVRFDPERIDPVREQAYWEPVVWNEVKEACR